MTRILAVEDAPGSGGYGIVTAQLIGVKNMTARAALDEFGEELFIKEDSKREAGKDKIPEKIFEIERRLLIPRRTGR